MTDLTAPAIREAGARALTIHSPWNMYAESWVAQWWDNASPEDRAESYEFWDRIAAELAPIIQQETVREQLRGGSYDADEEAPE